MSRTNRQAGLAAESPSRKCLRDSHSHPIFRDDASQCRSRVHCMKLWFLTANRHRSRHAFAEFVALPLTTVEVFASTNPECRPCRCHGGARQDRSFRRRHPIGRASSRAATRVLRRDSNARRWDRLASQRSRPFAQAIALLRARGLRGYLVAEFRFLDLVKRCSGNCCAASICCR